MTKAFCLLVLASIAITAIAEESGLSITDQWESYKETEGKSYIDEAEEQLHFELFQTTVDAVNDNNRDRNAFFTMGINRFSDMTGEEKKNFLGINPDDIEPPTRIQNISSNTRDFPTELDLSRDRCMANVKDQGSCGSCWAFNSNTPLEFSRCDKIGNQKKVILSEQQMIDCDTESTNNGCNGGWYTRAWEYLQAEGSNAHRAYGEYTGLEGDCKKKRRNEAEVESYTYISEDSIIEALNDRHLVAVAFNVVADFYRYKRGIYRNRGCQETVNHALVIVGYGVQRNRKYWIVRNSWGIGWGRRGYSWIERGVNTCNIEKYPAIVIAK